jgi:hypothetical protein
MYINLSSLLYITLFHIISLNFNTLLPTFRKILLLPLKIIFLYLPTPLAYCNLDFFIRTEVLAPEIFPQFGEQVEIATSKFFTLDETHLFQSLAFLTLLSTTNWLLPLLLA